MKSNPLKLNQYVLPEYGTEMGAPGNTTLPEQIQAVVNEDDLIEEVLEDILLTEVRTSTLL